MRPPVCFTLVADSVLDSRGSDRDYDDWAVLADDASWNSQNTRKYMLRHQSLEPTHSTIPDVSATPLIYESHGDTGPIKTGFNESNLPIESDWLRACEEVTHLEKAPLDSWGGNHVGFYATLGTVVRSGIDKGKRSYATRGYFAPNAHRSNLHVLCSALVSKVTLATDNRATGVSFMYAGSTHEVQAKREIIVSGGAVQSPQILELSGIGDPDVLSKAGVECKVVNNGVGKNLQDHPLTVCDLPTFLEVEGC